MKDQSSQEFYVPGLLPPASPKRPQELPKQSTTSSLSVQKNISQNKIHEQAVNIAAGKEASGPTASESTMQLPKNTSEGDECPEITASQAVNVQMLMDVFGGDDICNMSANSQQMAAASGFCVDDDENHKDDEVK